jgi:predicted nucleic acid-binding protein
MSGTPGARDRVYVDTSVWLSAFYGTGDVNHSAAEKFLRDLEAKNAEILVSSLVLMEVLDHLKDMAMRNPEVRKDPTPKAIGEFLESYFPQFYAKLYGTKGLSLENPSTPLSRTYLRAKPILNRALGHGRKIRKNSICPHCLKVHKYYIHKYAGPKRDDVMHALIAKFLGCKRFSTFDNGFNYLKDDENVAGIRFEIL